MVFHDETTQVLRQRVIGLGSIGRPEFLEHDECQEGQPVSRFRIGKVAFRLDSAYHASSLCFQIGKGVLEIRCKLVEVVA